MNSVVPSCSRKGLRGPLAVDADELLLKLSYLFTCDLVKVQEIDGFMSER